MQTVLLTRLRPQPSPPQRLPCERPAAGPVGFAEAAGQSRAAQRASFPLAPAPAIPRVLLWPVEGHRPRFSGVGVNYLMRSENLSPRAFKSTAESEGRCVSLPVCVCFSAAALGESPLRSTQRRAGAGGDAPLPHPAPPSQSHTCCPAPSSAPLSPPPTRPQPPWPSLHPQVGRRTLQGAWPPRALAVAEPQNLQQPLLLRWGAPPAESWRQPGKLLTGQLLS